jgi:hypothetical protein
MSGASVRIFSAGLVVCCAAAALMGAAAAAPSPHAYFDALAARPDTFGAWSLRTQASIDSVAQAATQSTWMYDATVDAARGVTAAVFPADADIKPQLWFPLNVMDGNVVIVWDYLRPATWNAEPQPFTDPTTGSTRPGLTGLKAFQVRTPPGRITFEIRNHFNYGSAAANEAALIDMRSYHETLEPGTYRAKTNTSTGVQGSDSETVQPLLARRFVHGNKWLRYVMKIEVNAGGYDYCSLWVIEEGGAPVQVYDRWAGNNRGGLHHFDIEEDASQQRAPGSAPLYTYVRDVWIGRNVTDVTPMLQTPGAGPLPLPPSNLRIIHP